VLDPARTYDLHSVIVPLPTDEEQTRIAVRLSRLPHGATVERVEGWIADLTRVAEAGAARLRERAINAGSRPLEGFGLPEHRPTDSRGHLPDGPRPTP
jgi:hypothetical protein